MGSRFREGTKLGKECSEPRGLWIRGSGFRPRALNRKLNHFPKQQNCEPQP